MDFSSLLCNCLTYLVLCWVICLVSSSPHTMSEQDVCLMWKRFADQVSTTADQSLDGPGIHSMCRYHPEYCEQLDCGGRSQFEIGMNIHFDYCFGLIMHHCDQPPWLEFILQVNKQNVHKKIYHNDSFQIPGLSINPAAVFLFVEFVKKDANHFEFSLTAKVRVKYGNVETWPAQEQATIIQPMPIPVTTCSKTTNSSLKTLHTCKVNNFLNNSTFPPDVYSTTTVKPRVKSATYHKKCEYGNVAGRHCSRNEMCKLSTVKSGVKKVHAMCVCQPDTKMNKKTGFCEGEKPSVPRPWIDIWDTTLPATNTQPTNANSNHAGDSSGKDNSSVMKNNTALIIGCVVGGVVIVVIVAAIIVVVMKKRGAQYRGRQLLLTEEDTDGAI